MFLCNFLRARTHDREGHISRRYIYIYIYIYITSAFATVLLNKLHNSSQLSMRQAQELPYHTDLFLQHDTCSAEHTLVSVGTKAIVTF